MWKTIDSLLQHSIDTNLFPGCAIATGQGSRVLYSNVFGNLSYQSSIPTTSSTLYDVGDLTRVLSTMPLVLIALERGMLSLDDTIDLYLDFVPSDKQNITILSLLTHTSGISSHFYLQQESENFKQACNTILKHELQSGINQKVIDSDMGYILLGFILEKIFSLPLDEAFKKYIARPLHFARTGFLPTSTNVAPTVSDMDTGELIKGRPQDMNARYLYGVAGNAGLFTDLEDLCQFATLLAGNGTNKHGILFSERAIHLAVTERTRGMNAARGYGFKIMKRSDPFLGHLWPSDGYGLQDNSSGSFIAVSPEEGFFVTFLTNADNSPQKRRELLRFHKLLLNVAFATFQHKV